MVAVAAVPPQIPGLVGWRPLARGGFATVWEAKQLSLNRLVAVKVDKRTLTSDAEQRRFLREAGAAGRMSGHPGIVTVHDAGILTDDRPYLVMALCEGGSLTKWVKGAPKPTQDQVREVGVRIADALAATHAASVLHRDVKPANILIDSYGHAGLADFGLAALPDPGMELSETLEAITPAYAPPEVFHRRPPTAAGDIYSLGATLYAMLAGRPPRWPESGTPNIVDMFERLQDPIDRIRGVHDGLMDALLDAMTTEPEERPTAAQLRDRLATLPFGPAEGVGAEPVTVLAGAATRNGGSTSRPMLRKGRGPVGPLDEADPLLPFPMDAPESGPPLTDLPPTDPPRTEEELRRPRRRALVLAAVIATLVALTLTAVLSGLLPRQNTVAPGGSPVSASTSAAASPSPSPSLSETPTPSPSAGETAEPSAVPAGFVDCSDELGEGAYCTSQPECWSGLFGASDSPRVLDKLKCEELHIFQTFAAGVLESVPPRQSTLDTMPEVQRTCTPSVLESMLVTAADKQADWQIYAINPQDDASVFRCIFGKADRIGPVQLEVP